MNSKPWRPPNNQQPPPSGTLSGSLSIQDLMGIYGFLNAITNPTEKIAKAKDNMENIILAFSQSLGSLPPDEQTRQ
jgi:hypothetical protein